MKNISIKSPASQFLFSGLLVVLTTISQSCNSSGTANLNPRNLNGQGPAPISLTPADPSIAPTDLRSAQAYVILAKTGISNVTGSSITGNIGVSPVAATYITGFSLIADASNQFSRSSSVVGNVYAATYAVPTPANLTSAIDNMQTAYVTAAGRTPPDFNELYTGNLGGQSLSPDLYKWGTSVVIPTNVTINGGPNDVWIFQIAGDLNIIAAQSIVLAGGAQAKNIFWQVAGQVTAGTTSHFEGIILSKTAISFQTSATMNGRAYAQSMVSIDNNTITQPQP